MLMGLGFRAAVGWRALRFHRVISSLYSRSPTSQIKDISTPYELGWASSTQ